MANYVSNVNEYIKAILTRDILPQSDLSRLEITRSGLSIVNSSNSREWPIELPDSVGAGLYEHEKSSTSRWGILANLGKSSLNPVFHSYYFKPISGGPMKIFDTLIAQSILELYPTPIQTYGTVYNGNIISGGVIDLNHLRTKDGHLDVKAMRLDMLLHSFGLPKEINSFMDLQRFMKHPAVRQVLSERAIVQIALESFFIPNAIGEVDANSRNIIVLFDPIAQRGEYAARIDAESNTYLNDLNNERSGKQLLPKGIFQANESFKDEFLKAIRDKSSDIDWTLFEGLTNLANKLTSRSYIDTAIFSGYSRNYGRVPTELIQPYSTINEHFGHGAYEGFSSATIERAKRYHNNVLDALGSLNHEIMPFGTIDASKPNPLEQVPFNEKGKPLTPEEEKFFGLE